MILRAFYFILILVVLATFPYIPNDMDKAVMLSLLVCAFGGLIIFFVFREEPLPNLRGQTLKHSTLALLGIMIVHFQYAIDYVIGNVSTDNWFIWINPNIVAKSLYYSVIGLLCFFLGYLSYKYRKSQRTSQSVQRERKVPTKILTGLAAILLVGYFATVNPLYLVGHYGSVEMGATATYLILLFELVIYAIIIQNSRNMIVTGNVPKNFRAYTKQQGYALMVLIIAYLLSVMFSGDRGPIMTFSIAYVSGYFFITKQKVSIKLALLLLFSGASFIFLLGRVRAADSSLNFSGKVKEGYSTSNRFGENSFFPVTQELAASVRSLHTAVSYIPEKHDYLYGRLQFQQLLSTIPFGNVIKKLIFSDNSYKYDGSAQFVTWINQGDNPTSGDGTTCIADFYFDFGVLGIIFGMFILGYLMRYAEVSMYSERMPGLFTHALFTCYLSSAIYFSRSSLLVEFKVIFWIYLILLINKSMQRRKLA